MQHLVYLHGFLSSAQSQKAQQTLAYAKKHFPYLNVHIPELSGDIKKTLVTLHSLMATLPMAQTCFIGSSMGGYLSTLLLETYAKDYPNSKAVLINPAIESFNLFKHYLGRHVNPYTGEVFYLNQDQISVIESINQAKLHDYSKYLVLLQSGDETLDYKLAVNKHTQARCVVEQGGDHRFVNYQEHLPNIFSYLLTPNY